MPAKTGTINALFNANSIIMWEEITTISEIDTVKAGTLLAKENPQKSGDTIIYKTIGVNPDEIIIMPQSSNNSAEGFALKADTLFEHGWWMLKEDHHSN